VISLENQDVIKNYLTPTGSKYIVLINLPALLVAYEYNVPESVSIARALSE
jgi:hypothetical protein